MNVNRPARVPTGIDRLKHSRPAVVGHLIPSKILLTSGIEPSVSHIGVSAKGIAVPNVYVSTRERCARTSGYAADVECQAQQCSGPRNVCSRICSDIAAIESLINEVWAFGELRSHYAREALCINDRIAI